MTNILNIKEVVKNALELWSFMKFMFFCSDE